MGDYSQRSDLLFRAFKYLVFALLAWNILLFFREDFAASVVTFSQPVGWRNVVEAFSATIDTLAWVVLLLLFELETSVISDEKLRSGWKWVFTALRAVCYALITYALFGYCQKFGLVSGTVPFVVTDVCQLLDTGFTYIVSLDEYLPLTADVCSRLNETRLVQIEGTQIIGTVAASEAATRLAVVDIVNASNWLLIVLLLEVEVYLQIREKLTSVKLLFGKIVKSILYMILLIAAAYWGVKGDFLDFWDAFLWLVAFLFIELNVFHWHEETGKAAQDGGEK